MRFFLSSIFILAFISLALGQTKAGQVDTISIYKSKAGIHFGVYKKEWFQKEKNYSYSWWPNRMTLQDSIITGDTEQEQAFYFKVFKSKKRLWFEGRRPANQAEMQGNICYYYPNGHIKRIEVWEDKPVYVDPCNDSVGLNDGPGIEGVWKYYRKDGSIKKTVAYKVKATSCKPLNGWEIEVITYYDKRGNVKSTKQKKLESL